MQKINEAFEEQNVDGFTEAVRLLSNSSLWNKFICYLLFQVKEYDAISRLDQWYTAILLKIKKSMSGEDESLR